MPRGLPDDRVQSYAAAAVTSDVGDVANREAGWAPCDGLGRPIWLDTFRDGLGRWKASTTGAGILPTVRAAGIPAAGVSYAGPAAALLDSGGPATNDVSKISQRIHLGYSYRVGIEGTWLVTNATPNHYLTIDYKPYGLTPYLARIIGVPGSTTIDIYIESAGALEKIYTISRPSAGNEYWYQAKIAADFQAGKYIRAVIGEKLIDISGYSLSFSGLTEEGILTPVATVAGTGSITGSAYLGYLIVTRDEP